MPKSSIPAAGEAMHAEGHPAAPSGIEFFEKLYSDWLLARSVENDPETDKSDKAMRAKTDTVEAAARLLLSTPVPETAPRMISFKWEVLESWADGGAEWTDNRVVFALGCIKADLRRFEFEVPRGGYEPDEPDEEAEPEADPALAAVLAFEAAATAFRHGPGGDEASQPFWEARETAMHALGQVQPTTPRGAAALLRVMLSDEADFVDKASPFVPVARNVAAFLVELDD